MSTLGDRNLYQCNEIFLHTHWSLIYAWVVYYIIICIGLHHIINFFLKSTNQLSVESFLNSDNRLVQEAMSNLGVLTWRKSQSRKKFLKIIDFGPGGNVE